MVIYVPINEDNLGGSIWIKHIAETLKQLGNDVRYCHFVSDTSAADYVLIQSEWIQTEAYKTSRRAIVLLGHFTNVVYPDSTKLRKNDVVVTQWKGEVVEDWEKRSGLKAHYFPHGYFPQEIQNTASYDSVWIGTETTFRDTSRLNGLRVQRIECSEDMVSGYYKHAQICPNIHLNIQKGSLVNAPESILEKPGFAVNERLFWIPGAGGFQIADENPLVRDFYTEDEVPMATKEDFKEVFEYYLNHPEKRQEMTQKARERTMREHTYAQRIKSILLPLL